MKQENEHIFGGGGKPLDVSPQKPKRKRFIVIAVVVVVLLAYGILANESDNEVDTETDTEVQDIVTEETTSTKEAETISDLDIVRKDGHPKYYGDTKQAYTTWKDIEKGKIVYPKDNDRYSEKSIVCFSGYRQGENNEIIRGIEVYFSNMDLEESVSLDIAVEIAKDYLPFDIIEQWYKFDKSYCVVEDENNQHKYYVVTYVLTESGSDAYYKHTHAYSGSIDVIIETNGNIANILTIGFGTPRWMKSLKTNGYHIENWEFATK